MPSKQRSQSPAALSPLSPLLELILHSLVIAGAVAATFSRLLTGPFTYLQYDDEKNYEDVAQLYALSEANVRWVLEDGVVLGVWEPVALLFKAAWHVATGGGGPAVCYAVSLALHALNALGAYALLVRGAGASELWRQCAALSALCFAVHPLRCEVLCWASCQPYLLSGLLVLAAVGLRGGVPWPSAGDAPPGAPRLLASASILLLGMLSKAAAVPVAAVLVCADFVAIAESTEAHAQGGTTALLAVWAALRRNAAALLAAVLGAVAATSANPANQTGHGELDGLQLALRACYSFWCYPIMSVYPVGMSIRYRAHPEEILLWSRFGAAAAASALVLAWLLLLAVRLLARIPVARRELRAGAAFGAYLLAVVPTLGFVQHGEPLLAADRYSYLPALLLGTPLLASGLHHAVSEWRIPRSAVFGTGVAVLGIFCALSRDYSAAYSTRESLWRRAVSLDPLDSGTVNQLALAVQKAGRHAEATPMFDRATQLRPDFADAWSNAGRSLLEMDRLDEALSRWSTAIQIKEHHRDAWLNRGVAMERRGRLEEAARDYQHVIASHPACASAWYNYGNLNERLGKVAEAEACFRSAVALAPRQPDFHNNLGNSMRDVPARNEEALHSYSSAIALKPSFIGARYNKASLFTSMERLDEASDEYTALLAWEPSYRPARVARGNTYLAGDRLDLAERDYRDALQSDPHSVSELNNLCLVLHRLDRLDEALFTCRAAITADPTHAWSWYNTGVTQHKMGDASIGSEAYGMYDESIASFRRVLAAHPGIIVAWESLAKVLESAGWPAEARESAERASSLRQSAAAATSKVPLVAAQPQKDGSPVTTTKLPLASSPPLPRMSNGLRVASAAEVAEQLAKQKQAASAKIDPAVPILSMSSLPNLVNQRATDAKPHALSVTNRAATDDNAPQNRVISRLKPLQDTPQIVRLPNPTQADKPIEVVIPEWQTSPTDGNTRGIVIVTSGSEPTLLREAYANAFLIRKVHSSPLSIEIFHIGPDEKFDAVSEDLFADLGKITILDLQATTVALLKGGRMGFHAKSAAVLASSFEEVLLLDSDSMLFQPPDAFFSQPGYLQSGFLLFRDYQVCLGSVSLWFLGKLGLSADEFCAKAHQQEIDSSAVVVNKRTAWAALHVIDAMNHHWPATVFTSEGYLLGDKDTWLIGSMLAKTAVTVAPNGPGVLAVASANGLSAHICSGQAQTDAENKPLYYNGQQLDEVLKRVAESSAGFDALRWVQSSELELHGSYEAALQKMKQGVPLSAGAMVQPPGSVARALQGVMTAFETLDRAGLGVVSTSEASLRTLITRANRFTYLGQHTEAVKTLQKAASLGGGAVAQAPVQKLLCESLLLLSQTDNALVACGQAVELSRSVGGTEAAKARTTYGVLFERLQRPTEALASHDSAVAADPSYAAAWHNRGVALEQLRRPADAVESYREAMRHGSEGSPETWINLGNALRDLPDKNEEALHAYTSVVQMKPIFSPVLNPTIVGARFNKASLLTSMKRLDDAAHEYTVLLDHDPSYRQARVARGNAYLAGDRLAEAAQDYRDALQSDPQSVSELNNLCLVLHRLDRLDEAMSSCRQAITIDPTHAWSRYNMGVTQHKLKSYDESIASFRWVLAAQPRWVVVWESLAKVLESAGRAAEARESAERAVALRRTLEGGGTATKPVDVKVPDVEPRLLMKDTAEAAQAPTASESAGKSYAARKAEELRQGLKQRKLEQESKKRELLQAAAKPRDNPAAVAASNARKLSSKPLAASGPSGSGGSNRLGGSGLKAVSAAEVAAQLAKQQQQPGPKPKVAAEVPKPPSPPPPLPPPPPRTAISANSLPNNAAPQK